MTTDRRRHGRQMKLAEVGEVGQAKLCATNVDLGAVGFARTIEARYLLGAGMRVVELSDGAALASADVGVTTLGLRHPASREVADGALRALVAMRAALGKRS